MYISCTTDVIKSHEHVIALYPNGFVTHNILQLAS